MKFISENFRDIDRYYNKCFCKFPEFGDTLFLITQVQESMVKGKTLDEDGKEIPFSMDLYNANAYASSGVSPPDVDFILPHKSYFDYEGCASFLYRVPARQYKRGVSSENTAILRLTGDGWEKLSINFRTLKAYVEKQKFSTFRLPKEGSAAITPRMALDSGGKVYIDRSVVGLFSGDFISLKSDLFLNEVTRAMREHHQNFPVKILGKD